MRIGGRDSLGLQARRFFSIKEYIHGIAFQMPSFDVHRCCADSMDLKRGFFHVSDGHNVPSG